jgi:hypothetical protein
LIASDTPGAIARASVSATPPGGKLTIRRTGLSGHACAAACAQSSRAANSANVPRAIAKNIVMVSPPVALPNAK